uniref:glycosyltransferase family 2 protein n=1 Tax=Endozoicomonas sp. SESOKO2 TaxID=2828743 RepID=UPI002148B45A
MLKKIRRLTRLSIRRLTLYLAQAIKLLPIKQSLRLRALLGEKPRRHPTITGLKVCNHQFKGYIDEICSNVISGWLYSDTKTPIALTLEINGRSTFDTTANIFRQDLLDNGLPTGQAGFRFLLPEAANAKAFDFRILSKLCGSIVFSGRYIAEQTTEQINSLHNIQKALRSGQINGIEGPASEWLLEQVIPGLMQNIRSSNKVRIPPLKSQPFTEKAPSLAPEVDIIIPVYSGLKETQDCIKSVLNAIYEMPYEIIVINDAGPDSILNEWLRDLGDQQKITLYENSVNLGFVGTVNKGMKLHPERDIILLNSDTIVSNNWLDRLKNAAYS